MSENFENAELARVFAKDLFLGSKVLVTGGGSGIGLRIASDFANYGAFVTILGRDEEKLKKAESTLKSLSGANSKSTVALKCDIRQEEEIEQVLQTIQANGGLDILINNAGGQFPSPTEKISAKGFKAVIENNLTGTFLMTRACFLKFFKAKGGSIVNITMDNKNGMPLMPHSAASRAGVDNLTKSWAIEWAEFGVRVNAVAPGIIRSSGLDTYAPEFQAALQKMTVNNYAYRFGTEAEVSASTLFLCSPGAAYITGATLCVDGGESIYSPFHPPKKHEKLPPYDG